MNSSKRACESDLQFSFKVVAFTCTQLHAMFAKRHYYSLGLVHNADFVSPIFYTLTCFLSKFA